MKKILLALLFLIGLQTQAQQVAPYFCCDSITYWTDQGQGLSVGLDTSNIVHDPDSIQVWWGVCNTSMCYGGSGINDFFGQITTSDTIKVCYDAILYTVNTIETCTRCDSLVFNGANWVLFSMGNPTVINEIRFVKKDNIIYDITGREVIETKLGQIYIKNNKKYIRIK